MSTDSNFYKQAAERALLTGSPFKSLVDAVREQAAREAAAKVVDLKAARARLRPTDATDPAAA